MSADELRAAVARAEQPVCAHSEWPAEPATPPIDQQFTGRLSENFQLESVDLMSDGTLAVRGTADVPDLPVVDMTIAPEQVESREGPVPVTYSGQDDPLVKLASEQFGVPIGEVTPDQRRQAKALAFGQLYGKPAMRASAPMTISGTVTGRSPSRPEVQDMHHTIGKSSMNHTIDFRELELRMANMTVVRLGQVHEELTNGQRVMHPVSEGVLVDVGHTLHVLQPDYWLVAVEHRELGEQIKRLGQAGDTSQLPVGSVVSYTGDGGHLYHYYKCDLPDMWKPAETDGKPTESREAEDWSKVSPESVSVHGIYFQDVGMGWPIGVEPMTVTSKKSRSQRKLEHRMQQRRKGEPSLKGAQLEAYREQRRASRKQKKANKRKSRK